MSEEKPKIKIDGDKDPKTLRTYMSDMADVVRQNEMSVIKVALAEQKKKESQAEYKKVNRKQRSKRFFFILGGILIILAALAGSYLLINKIKEKNIAPQITKIPDAIISYDNRVPVDITTATSKSDLSGLINTEVSKRGTPASITELTLMIKRNETTNTATTEDLVHLLELTAPGSLTRSLADKYMVGFYTPIAASEKNHLFLIFKTSDYNIAYAGMLEWEKTMFDDLFTLFGTDVSGINKELFGKSFKDIIIKNKDARILYNSNGEDKLFYIFLDKNTLLITDNKEAIKEIITRFLIKQTKTS